MGNLQERRLRFEPARPDQKCQAVKDHLPEQEHGVAPGFKGQKQIGGKRDKKENRYQPAQQFVAEILIGEQAVAPDIQKFSIAEKHRKPPKDGTHLAIELLLAVGNIRVHANCPLITDPAQPQSHAVEHGSEITLHVPGKIPAHFPPGGKKRPAKAHQRIDPGFQRPQPHLVAHIKPFPARLAVPPQNTINAAHATDGRVSEIGGYFAQTVRLDAGGCIGKNNDLAGGNGHGILLSILLAPTLRQIEEFYPMSSVFQDNGVGLVRGTVGSDDDLQEFTRIIENKRVFELLADTLSLVACGDDQSQGRQV